MIFIIMYNVVPGECTKEKSNPYELLFFRREDRIRTCDPLVPNQVRYRPAPLPELLTFIADKTIPVSAEREGFEPSVQFNPYDGLANRSFRPLRHLSLYCGVAKIGIIYNLPKGS